ncbi:hypothetical protein SteCoe_16738 [Stentor coeruleus]|uniref:Uncharacterized protein n=1 Tax=Stentor coeruleus TaxID=5963 RepID=A0A1R2C0G9_9CILI|nr:hypothetical protein SteCoe_16738 [Stentor coeruleus]
MSNWLECLKNENTKLKKEAKTLRDNLKLVKEYNYLKRKKELLLSRVSYGSSNDFSNRPTETSQTHRKTKSSTRDKENLVSKSTKSTKGKSFNLKVCEDCISKIFECPKERLLLNGLYKPRTSSRAEGIKDNNVDVAVFKEQERDLLESFESYYQSEEENIDKNGKCELDYILYKSNHIRGSRREQRSKESLTQMFTESNHGELPARCTRTEVSTRSLKNPSLKSQSLHPTKPTKLLRSLFSQRKNPCKTCDFLLSQGYKTTLCSKHAIQP